MTYIAAFQCQDGIVLCTDTQETVGDQKRDVEKLYVAQSYPLALGAAGIDEAIDAFAQEVVSSVEQQRPETIPALRALLETALKEVIERDSKTSAYPTEYRKAQYIVAARPNKDKFAVFRVRGKRVYLVKQPVIIGYETAANYSLLKRMHTPDFPMQQAVMLGVYLVSQSKELDAYVGGDTRVAVVTGDRAWLDYPEYIKNAERRIAEFLKLIDRLFLLCVDVTIRPSKFPAVLEAFAKDVTRLRDNYLRQSAAISLMRSYNDPDYCGEPYSNIFLGAIMTVKSDGTIEVSEETEEQIEQRRKMLEQAGKAVNAIEIAREFQELIKGRQFVFTDEKEVIIRGTDQPENP